MGRLNHTNFKIIDFSENYYPQLLKLWKETGLANPERADDLSVINNTVSHGGKLLLLINTPNNELVGSSWLTTDYRRLYLHHFGIAKKYQGKGLAHLLMKASMDFARKLGLQVKLEVHKDNFIAMNLYKQWNFKELGDYKVLIIRNLTNIPPV